MALTRDFKETVKEQAKSSFGGKKEPAKEGEQPAKRGWGRK